MGFEWLNSRIADETMELVFVFNRQGDILFANKTAANKLEYEKDELVKCNMSWIFRQDFLDPGDFIKNRLEEKKESAMYRKNSSCFSADVRIFPGDKDDTYVLLAEDITGWKDMNTRIRKLKKEEEANLRERNEFTANITHELRTPVNGIKGHAMELLDKVEDEEQRKTLDIILYCCENMLAIINNILDYAKLETGKFTIEEKEFDFYKMMDRVIATHSAEINKKELRFGVNVDERIPQFVIGDELRLVQILNNLLSNAIKFTMIGFVDVVVSRTMQVNDEVEIFFMVRDSGIGISPKEQNKLFRSFNQADASITRRFGGTGLGLVITKQLVELMQGRIQLESEKGKGSTFSFSVKLRTNQNVEERNNAVYESWENFTKEDHEREEENFLRFGENANREEIKKRMDKLVLSIELGAWDKAEMLASTIKELAKNGDDEMKRKILRMEMVIRKSDYEKSMDRYEDVKKAFTERMGEL